MKTIRHTHKPVVRFRCWSRKGYAAFASLGRQVTIGQLHLNVTERSLSKQKAAQTIPFNLFMTIEERPGAGRYRYNARASSLAG